MITPFPDKEYVDRVMVRLRKGLERRLSTLLEHGHPLAPPEKLAERMLNALPTPSSWDSSIGPFYGSGQIAQLLGNISRQAVADRRERRRLLGVKNPDGVVLYPAFQLDEHNRVLKGLPEVLQCFRGVGSDDWAIARWLLTPLRPLRGSSVIDWLRNGGALDKAVAQAEAAARRLSR
jgi:hypothetical protein